MKRQYGPLALILAIYLALGVLYALVTPLWQTPDEPAHYNYLRQLATTGQLPVLRQGDYDQAYLEEIKARRFPPEMAVDSIRYEGHQPPLYYALASPLFWIAAGRETATQVRILRLFGVLLGAGVIALMWASVRRLFPTRAHLAHMTAGIAAFLPMHVAMMASINNDALAELVIALGVFRLLGHLKHRRWPARAWLLTGVIVGMGMLTKFQAYILLPLTGLVWLWLLWDCRKQEAPAISWRQGLAWMAPALLLPLAWWLRNASIYGFTDPLGLHWHDAVVLGQPRTSDWIAASGWGAYLDRYVSFTFQSFWGVFGWLGVFLDSRVYTLLLILSALAVAGLLWQLRRWRRNEFTLTGFQKQGLAVLAAQVLIVLSSYLWYNLSFVQHQGRYLFPALLPLSLGFAIGLGGVFSQQSRLWGALAALVVAGCVGILGLAGGDVDKWGIVLSLLAVVALAALSRVPAVRANILNIATLALLVAVDLYALFGAILSQLT